MKNCCDIEENLTRNFVGFTQFQVPKVKKKNKKKKLSLYNAVESSRAVRRRDSPNFLDNRLTDGS
jgi:hypothetical protein